MQKCCETSDKSSQTFSSPIRHNSQFPKINCEPDPMSSEDKPIISNDQEDVKTDSEELSQAIATTEGTGSDRLKIQ